MLKPATGLIDSGLETMEIGITSSKNLNVQKKPLMNL